jgi:hypothetical protein
MDELPPDRLIEALGQHGSNSPHRRGGKTAVSLLGEQLVDVTDVKFDKFFVSETRQNVHPNHRLVVAKGAGRNLVAHDVIKPSLKELGDLDVFILE